MARNGGGNGNATGVDEIVIAESEVIEWPSAFRISEIKPRVTLRFSGRDETVRDLPAESSQYHRLGSRITTVRRMTPTAMVRTQYDILHTTLGDVYAIREVTQREYVHKDQGGREWKDDDCLLRSVGK